MNGRDRALAGADQLATALTEHGVTVDPATVLDRSEDMTLAAPGLVSPNGTCRLVRAADGWIAVNLPRTDDADLVPAWTGTDWGAPVWPSIAAAARTQTAATLVATGAELGLAVARLSEAQPGQPVAARPLAPVPVGPQAADHRPRRVLDLSTLWAGPLCAGLLAQAGHSVVKVESITRPDPVAQHTPVLDARLNGAKARRAIRFDAANLAPLLAEADVIVTSARPRAFAALGLNPRDLAAARPGLVWVAITGHGWHGAAGRRTGFGDDAAVAGGLVVWHGDTPHFAGDALADPLTGLAAGLAALRAIARGGGVMIDAALAHVAARVATGQAVVG